MRTTGRTKSRYRPKKSARPAEPLRRETRIAPYDRADLKGNSLKLITTATLAALLTSGWLVPRVFAQSTCPSSRETVLAGTVKDATLALIPGAAVVLDGNRIATSGADGHFRFPCVSSGTHHLSASASGFSPRDLTVTTPHGVDLQMVLETGSLQTNVEVNADEQAIEDPNANGATETISGKQLQSLADDPDDLLRELQQMGALSGGSPTNTTIAVDGFQGTSKLPPKSSIAYIKVNPDMFSAEYREPPFDGGRVEVYTKPGQSAFHGALFATNGSPWENARDPFSTSKAAIGKQRYGFELTGPVRKQGSDFALDLEHRSIDNFAVVNAITLNGGNGVSTIANVATPQRLWIGQARLDWQLGAKNTFIATYSANVNSLLNVGVGGTNLAETGYNSGTYEHVLRFTNITTASVHLMNEARFSLRWDGEDDLPNSTATQVAVAGAFTGGGSTLGAQQLHELNVEGDDDAILTTKAHTLKFGTQLMLYNEHQQLTSNFNGTYTFGGGSAPVLDAVGNAVPGQTEIITGLEQYRRATNPIPLPGGTPSAFSSVTGTPAVNFTQVQDATFVQDDWNVGHGLHIASGLRYFVQNDPAILSAITPRVGVLWSPGKKGTWTLHGHAGLFTGQFNESEYAELRREDGVNRITSTIYNPVYNSPFTGTTPIHSARTLANGISNATFSIENIGGTRTLPHGWTVSADYYLARIWNETRSVNINAPLNGNPTGPRPGAPNADILQVQNSGQGPVNVEFLGIEQHTLKYVQLFFGGVRENLVDDSDDNTFFSPQSSYTDAGEFAHRTNQPTWNVFGNATFTLPRKIQLSGDLNAGGDAHYNITTGFDNNGDGNFNDRPQYAAPGTPGAVQTPFGLLAATGGTGVFPRNKGVLPWTFHLDTNIQRAFTLTHNAKAEHQQVLTANVRSSNVLNHTNVTSVGGVFNSPLFGVPYAADNGRRVEGGLRYSF